MVNHIKACSCEQLELLRDISIETYRDTFTDSNSDALMQQYLDTALTREKLQMEFHHPGSQFYFIYSAGQVAGFLKVNEASAQITTNVANALEVERFYIRKTFLRKGLGKELMGFACELAQQAKKESLYLGVWEGNFRALHFYKRMGFEKVGSHLFDMGGEMQTDWVLKKEIKEQKK
ncbi:GNAT family N-acetyltransferase [Psychromonas antarctica]|jgi:ribosomal protein S18 acetylase RimI-like enzyme|uniref:GNAT family N-acetyltransferase n=1 Tax=Psychromonas antarctica TaxID=67573 RepID=UPI001EE92865|nr:GNAT family N-acetyltransferase [Psychromonas antarctica]MCG6200048.1 GNAT family N-acetyltransferase [Psychromonas antarctica]